jgi:hypothetical protein
LRRLLESVLHKEVQVVLLVQDLAADVGVELHEPSDLTVLLGHELLVERRDLDVDIELGQVEVRGEALSSLAGPVPVDVERRGLVVPRDLIEIQQLRELPLAVVSEANQFVGKRVASAWFRLLRALRYG